MSYLKSKVLKCGNSSNLWGIPSLMINSQIECGNSMLTHQWLHSHSLNATAIFDNVLGDVRYLAFPGSIPSKPVCPQYTHYMHLLLIL